MKIIFKLIICYINLIQIIESRKIRVYPSDELLPYTLGNNVLQLSDMMSTANLIFEQIDDGKILIEGHVVWLQSMDRNLPIQNYVRSQYLEHGIWKEGILKLALPNICPEYLNHSRFWYNVTKLWTSEVCPPQKGDIWRIERQYMTAVLDFPPSISLGTWRAYILITQGVPGFEKNRFGLGLEIEFELA